MIKNPSKTPIFSFSALQRAMDKLYPAIGDDGGEGPQNPERRMLMKQAGAAALASAVPATSLLSGAAKISQNADLEAALQSYITYIIQFNDIWAGMSGEQVKGAGVKNIALLNKIYSSTNSYYGFSSKLEYNFEKDPKAAVSAVEDLIAEARIYYQKSYLHIRFLIKHPEALGDLAERIAAHPEYIKGNVELQTKQDVMNYLQYNRDHFTDDASVTELIQSKVRSFTREGNGWLYRRFGQFLPETTAEEAEAIKTEVRKNLAQNFNSTYGSPVTVQKYSEDAYEETPVQPTYLMNLNYKKDNTPEKNSEEFHELIAKIKARYPCKIYTGDTMDLDHQANIPGMLHDKESLGVLRADNKPTLLLTPTRMGILVTFPAGFESTQLVQFQELLNELVAKNKTLPKKAEQER